MACEPETDLENAGQFSSIIPPGLHAAVQSYLLAKIRGGSMDVNEIMQEAKCYSHCIPPRLMPRIKTWLLCQLSNTGGETPIPPSPECDADAQAFITAAGLTPGSTEANAVCVLVRDLKAYPAVGTKFWDRDVLIYPFVGGNAVAHAVNLKTPGTYDLLFLGVTPPIHSANGVQGRLATCWINSQYIIPLASQDNIRVMYYLHSPSSTTARFYYGCESSTPNRSFHDNHVTGRTFVASVNATTASVVAGTKPSGAYFIQRKEAANQQYALLGNPWTNSLIASLVPPLRYLYLLAIDTGGGTPTGNAASFSDATLSSFSLGTVFDAAGGQAEKDEYKGIWDAFNNTLGRGHP